VKSRAVHLSFVDAPDIFGPLGATQNNCKSFVTVSAHDLDRPNFANYLIELLAESSAHIFRELAPQNSRCD
jgi:hypothetical protein